jgi:hypothetical protein
MDRPAGRRGSCSGADCQARAAHRVFVANMLLDAWAAAIGQPAHFTDTVAEITGAPPRTFQHWAAENVAAFRG